MAVAMAASGCAVGQVRESLVFCRGDLEIRGGLAKRGVSGVGFADRSHESFYALRVRCGKKQKSLALKMAKVQELVKVQRDLVLSSQQSGRGAPEGLVRVGVSDPGLDRIMKSLQDLQMEVGSINVNTKKKKGSSSSSSSSSNSTSSDCGTGNADTKSVMGKKRKNGSSSSSSGSSSSSSDSGMGKAMDMRAFRKKQIGTSAAQPIAAIEAVSSVPGAPVEAVFIVEAPGVVMSSAPERIATGVSVSTSCEEEPAIVAQIRALCNTVSASSSAHTREIYTRGPIELEDTPSGRVVVNPPSVAGPVSKDASHASTSGKIEVCTVGKCRRGGSQQILASLQESIPESSNISVTSCKCMGKCKSAPNVRVKNSDGQSQLLNHVTVDDVGTLLGFHFGVQSLTNAMPPLFARIDSDFAAAG